MTENYIRVSTMVVSVFFLVDSVVDMAEPWARPSLSEYQISISIFDGGEAVARLSSRHPRASFPRAANSTALSGVAWGLPKSAGAGDSHLGCGAG